MVQIQSVNFTTVFSYHVDYPLLYYLYAQFIFAHKNEFLNHLCKRLQSPLEQRQFTQTFRLYLLIERKFFETETLKTRIEKGKTKNCSTISW